MAMKYSEAKGKVEQAQELGIWRNPYTRCFELRLWNSETDHHIRLIYSNSEITHAKDLAALVKLDIDDKERIHGGKYEIQPAFMPRRTN